MIILSAIALLIAAASGWCLVSMLWTGADDVFEQMARIVLAVAIGLSLHSLTDFVLLLIVPGIPVAFFAIDLIVLAVMATLWSRSCRKRDRATRPQDPKPNATMFERIVLIAVLVIGCWMVLAVVGWLGVSASGQWDAWAMWNFKARVIARGGEYWTHVLTPPSPHPDYPMHQPITIARLWRYCGSEPGAIPQAHAVLVASLTFLWLVGVAGAVRGAAAGCIAGALLASNMNFSRHAGSQYADITVGLYMALSLGLLYRAMIASDRISPEGNEQSPPPIRAGTWLLTGLALGGAAWTKHEGQFFAASTIAIVTVAQWVRVGRQRARQQVVFMLMGALPGLMCAALVHGLASWYEPISSLHGGIAGQPQPSWARIPGQILDPEHHRMILHSIMHLTDAAVDRILWVLVFGYVLCAGMIHRNRRGRHLSAILIIGLLLLVMVGGYYGAYLLTTAPPGWHLQTSASRLAIQIWPCAVLAFALTLGGLCETRSVAKRSR